MFTSCFVRYRKCAAVRQESVRQQCRDKVTIRAIKSLSIREFCILSRRVTAVGKDRLSGDPPTVGRQEFHDRDDVLDVGELAVHTL